MLGDRTQPAWVFRAGTWEFPWGLGRVGVRTIRVCSPPRTRSSPRRPASNEPDISTATRRSLSNEARLRPPRLNPVTVGVPDGAWYRWRSADPSFWRWPSPGPSWPGSCPWGRATGSMP
jgi:hypothetical protein